MAKGFESFDSIFGEAIAEWESPSSLPLLPFLFRFHSLDASRIRIHVTDFHSYTWESIRSIQQLEDLRENIGVGGSWSEFVDYLIASIKSDNVKLVMGGLVASTISPGATYAKLIAHKAKGMPLIAFPLERLTNSSANDAMANLSCELFKTFKTKHDLVVTAEQERSYQLTKILSAEREKTESLQNQLDMALFSRKQKLRKSNTLDKPLPIANAVSNSHDPLEKPQNQDFLSTKNNRVVPAHRRAKARGVLLGDTDEDD